MLKLCNVSYRYPDDLQSTVETLSFQAEKGGFYSILGASGCGKSTLFRLINGLLTPQEGEILVDGKSIQNQKQYCGYMPQKDLLFPWRTVAQNVRLPLELRGGLSRAECSRQVNQALAEVGLERWRDKLPNALSGGMRQRAAFARTLLTGSDLLLLDEPFSALDSLTRLTMQEWLLDQWQRHQKTILFITHDVEEAVFLSKTVYVVEETPIRHLRAFPVPAEYPRMRTCLAQPELLRLKEELVSLLRKQVQP